MDEEHLRDGDAAEGADREETEAPDDKEEAPRGAVLIVDDEPDVRESTALLIEALGYRAIRLGDPSEILETVERERPDLILQDLKIPGLNVAGLVASLRSDPSTATIPLVFFSASGDLSSTAARYDAWGYLAKPFGAAELASLLEKVLSATPAGTIRSPQERQRDVRNVFHDYWNLISAMANYVQILGATPGLPEQAQKSAVALHDLVLKLESKTDRLRAFSLAQVGATTAVGRAPAPPVAPTPPMGKGGRPPAGAA